MSISIFKFVLRHSCLGDLADRDGGLDASPTVPKLPNLSPGWIAKRPFEVISAQQYR
jgi:hypothetical protein